MFCLLYTSDAADEEDVHFDLADGLYSITGADGVSTEPQCVFIGRQLRPAEIAARLADPAAFI